MNEMNRYETNGGERTHCPGCGRHCSLTNPGCERGEAFARGELPPRQGGQPHGRHGGPGGHGHGAFHSPHGRPDSWMSEEEREARYQEEDIDGRLAISLRELGHAPGFMREGMGGQRRAMRLLARSGGMTQRELTERMGIQPGSASELIGKLEESGLVERTENERDRRTMNLKLTVSGGIQAEMEAQEHQARRREMFSCYTQEEKETLLALLEKLRKDWKERYREEGRGPRVPHGMRRGGFDRRET